MRLTYKLPHSQGYAVNLKGMYTNVTCEEYCADFPSGNGCDGCLIDKAIRKLARYEDLEEQGGLIEVIRCKDCIRHSDEYEVGADGISWCDEHERLTDDDDYCSYAVAKLAEMEGAE